MIDQIRIAATESANGKRFDQICIWVAGVPFFADNSEHNERLIRRLARDQNIEFVDLRSQENASA